MREEHRLRIFENGVLRRIFGVKRDEVIWEWRKLHNEKLNGLYSHSIDQIDKNVVGGSCSTCGESRDVYWVLVGKLEGKSPLGRTRRRWEDNIKMDLKEMGCEVLDWIIVAQGRNRWRALVNAVMNLGFP